MEFGYGLVTAQRPPTSSRDYSALYEQALELATLAEDSGFDAVWTSEHHFFADGYAPSVLPLSAAIARETREIDIGTAVALAPLYHPIRLAEDAATVDLLSGGRFRLGLANGYVAEEFETFGVPRADRAPRVEDAVAICRGAWADGSFSYDGYRTSLEEVTVTPTPSGDGPPIYLGGVAEAAVRRSGRLAGAGYLGIVYHGDDWGGPFTTEQFLTNLDYIREERGGNLEGFTPGTIQFAHVASSDDEAWAELLPHIAYTQRVYAEHNDRDDPARWDLDAIDPEREAALRAGALVGSPDTIVERLRRLDELVPGEMHVCARLYHPKMSFEEQSAVVRRFGDEVIARLA